MKIGIDARMYGSGFTGIGRYTYELIKTLAEIDSDNEYVIFLRKEAYDAFEPPNERFTKVLADFPHYSFAEQFGFNSLLNKTKLDLMHFCHFNAPILYNKPYIVTVHDLTLSFFPGKKMNSFWHRMAYRKVLKSVTKKAKKIIAVSEHTKKDLQKMFSIPDEKIIMIYNGVSAEFSEPSKTLRPERMSSTRSTRLLFLL